MDYLNLEESAKRQRELERQREEKERWEREDRERKERKKAAKKRAAENKSNGNSADAGGAICFVLLFLCVAFWVCYQIVCAGIEKLAIFLGILPETEAVPEVADGVIWRFLNIFGFYDLWDIVFWWPVLLFFIIPCFATVIIILTMILTEIKEWWCAKRNAHKQD